MQKLKYGYLIFALALTTLAGMPPTVLALEQTGEEVIEEVVVLGSRRDGRSVGDSPTPVDVIRAEELTRQGNTDLNTLLRNVIPSFNVNTQAINDAATLVRPANLHGLPADSTLVLVNGKRRHRASVVTFLGGGINDGAQGPDIYVLPTIGLKQVEVLRDGASAQYGSDAIAGVINFTLKDDAEGGSLEARWGEFYEGDGDTVQVAGNFGLPLTDHGFANLSFEFSDTEPTSRSVQRADAQTLTETGNNLIANPVQIWGAPKVSDDFKLLANIGLDLGDHRLYLFGNRAGREVEGGFYFRNPNTRSGVFSADDGQTLLVGDIGNTGACPVISITDDVPDPLALAAVQADDNCFTFYERYPGGFTPHFGGTITDASLAAGVSGKLAGMTYDLSAGYGRNKAEFTLTNTVNASLGPDSPSAFKPGTYTETDLTANLDLGYLVSISGLASDLHIAGGFEYRKEEFEIKAGDPASHGAGPLTSQGFSVGSNGFQGFNPKDAGVFDRTSNAIYLELDADITPDLLTKLALRWEDYEDFSATTNGKFSTRWQLTDGLALRAAVSTGFRVPTVGQTNVRSTATNIIVNEEGNRLVEELIAAPTSSLALVKGSKPLEPEESVHYSIGTVFDIGPVNVTLDYFDIEVTDRIALTSALALTDQERADLLATGVADAMTISSVRFFTNDFDTDTKGFDLVASYPLEDLLGGDTSLSLAYNRTRTEVTDRSSNIDDTRVRQLEDSLPVTRWILTGNHRAANYAALVRLSWYDDFFEAHADAGDLPIEAGSTFTLDVELSYLPTEQMTFTLGAQNIGDEYPDRNPHASVLGATYPVTSPIGFGGGFYYFRVGYRY